MTDPLQFSQSLRKWMDTFSHRSMRDSARFVKNSGYSMPQFFLLMQVYRQEHCGISDLSDYLEITNAAVSQLVDKLVQAGMLTRNEDPNDRRAKKVALSPEGRAFLEQGFKERYLWVDQLEDQLSEEEEQKVAEALKILNNAIMKLENRDKRLENS
jgi:DNA-binding MarR family transcriptional regulator